MSQKNVDYNLKPNFDQPLKKSLIVLSCYSSIFPEDYPEQKAAIPPTHSQT
ncbi:MAG: hypothetical protein IME94_02680 [Proteobacteria bacterium]|nr:hypothetical protein [Pseudomonadota bacterium]